MSLNWQSWARCAALLGLSTQLAVGCIITTGDDEFDGRGARGGTGGSGARAGRGGADVGGSDSGGSAGTDSNGDGGYVATCEPEDGDELDPCLECVKRECCTEWLDCGGDDVCYEEWFGVSACMLELEQPGENEYAECASASALSTDMLVQENTNALLLCIREEVESEDGVPILRCGLECYGVEFLF